MSESIVNTFYPSKPHATQFEALAVIDKERFVVLRAGRKWRKTSLGISWLFEQALMSTQEHGATQVFGYIAPNRVQAKNIVWNDHIARMLHHFAQIKLPYQKNEVELSVVIPGHGKVQLFGVENYEALRGISNWGALVCDEYDDWVEDIWPLVIRPNLMTTQAHTIFMGTPKGKKNLWRLVNDAQYPEVHYTTFQNPEMNEKELSEVVEEYKKLGEDYYKQEILAEYVKPVGAVYREWNEERQYKEITYDPNLPLHVTWDFGINDPTAIIWIQPYGSEIRIIDYYEAANADLGHFISVVRSKAYRSPDLVTGDPAGNSRELVSGVSPIEELAKHGIHVRTKTGVTIPEQIRTAHRYIPSTFISTNCSRFRDILLNYKYPEKKENILNQSNEIPLHDEWSHGARAFEYWAVNYGEVGNVKELTQIGTTKGLGGVDLPLYDL